MQVICFSKNRPLQLHGYLSSLFANIPGTSVIVKVLCSYDDPYASAYTHIANEFPSVTFFQETNFSDNLAKLIDPDIALTCFGCDDVIFIAPVDVTQVTAALSDTGIVGASFRLGATIQHGMFWQEVRQPNFKQYQGFLRWTIPGADADWCYPWDVLGTVYRTDFVLDLWPALIHANNPSRFEESGANQWPNFTLARDYICWPTPRTVIPTVNVVQNQFANGIIGQQPLSPEFLLDCWNNGLRIDFQSFVQLRTSSWRVGDFYLCRQP